MYSSCTHTSRERGNSPSATVIPAQQIVERLEETPAIATHSNGPVLWLYSRLPAIDDPELTILPKRGLPRGQARVPKGPSFRCALVAQTLGSAGSWFCSPAVTCCPGSCAAAAAARITGRRLKMTPTMHLQHHQHIKQLINGCSDNHRSATTKQGTR